MLCLAPLKDLPRLKSKGLLKLLKAFTPVAVAIRGETGRIGWFEIDLTRWC
jgi:hypothetical protein